MAKKRLTPREEIDAYKTEFNLLVKVPCTQEENEMFVQLLRNGGDLPSGVYAYGINSEYEENIRQWASKFYTLRETDLSESEIREYLTFKQLNLLDTIKKCIVFFTVLTIIELIALLLIVSEIF